MGDVVKADHHRDSASEARDLVRRAVGDASGLTIKAQLRQAERNLGYGMDGWRVRDAWYGRAGRWGAATIQDLRQQFAAWRERASCDTVKERCGFAAHVAAIRTLLREIERHVTELEQPPDNTSGGFESDVRWPKFVADH